MNRNRSKKQARREKEDPYSQDGSHEGEEVLDEDELKEIEFLEKYRNALWTRVIKINETETGQISFYNIKEELEEFSANPLPSKKTKKKKWQLIFDPERLEKDS